jgi:DNA-binding CsgD family transcriptional regulator
MTKTAISSLGRQVPALVPSARTPESVCEDQLLGVFERLVRRLAAGRPSGEMGESSPAALLEIEHDGRMYCLLCRKKAAMAAGIDLSPREREIVRMIAEGYPNKAVAGVLEISEWTVGTHLRRIFAKLGVSCRAAMVARWLDLH